MFHLLRASRDWRIFTDFAGEVEDSTKEKTMATRYCMPLKLLFRKYSIRQVKAIAPMTIMRPSSIVSLSLLK